MGWVTPIHIELNFDKIIETFDHRTILIIIFEFVSSYTPTCEVLKNIMKIVKQWINIFVNVSCDNDG